MTTEQASLKKARLCRIRTLIALRAAEKSKGPLRWQADGLRYQLSRLNYMVRSALPPIALCLFMAMALRTL